MADAGNQSRGTSDLGPTIGALAEGQKVFDGRYTLMKIVGHSPLSVVWLAWDEKQDRDVALKYLPEMVKEDASALATLKREVFKLQELRNPLLIPIYAVENEGKAVAIVSEYIEGATFSELRSKKSNLVYSPTELADWLQQLCRLLDYGHSEVQLAHGALKPSNLIVSQKGALRASDFAIERHVTAFINRVSEGRTTAPNFTYLSPQQAAAIQAKENAYVITAADDIYSLGATLYELLTSRAPFYTGDILLQLKQKIPPPMTHRRKELRVIGDPIPRVWEETIAACLSKDPTQRPQTIAQVVEMFGLTAAPALAEALPAQEVEATPAGSNKLMIAGGVMVLAIAALLGLVFAKGKKPDTGNVVVTRTNVVTTTNLSVEATKALKDAEAKRVAAEAQRAAAEAETKRLLASAEKARQDEAKRSVDAEKARKVAEDKRLATEAEIRILQLAMENAKKMAGTQLSPEMVAKQKESEVKAKQLQDELNKLKDAEAKRMAATEKEKKDNDLKSLELKRKQAEAAKMAAANAEKIREMNLAKAKAEEEEKQRIMADIAQKEADAKKMQMAKLADDAKAKALALEEARRKALQTGKPWDNSLGIKFMPVGGVHFAAWECRLADFEAFIKATGYDAGRGWKSPGFLQGRTHPVVNVSWADAQAFCKWLTEKERKEGLIGDRAYRLPTDLEWSQAVKLPNESGNTPLERDGGVKGFFPWGNVWPPPAGAGNYGDTISYDRFENTAPAGSFPPNAYGLHDTGGNVWEWTEDWSDNTQKARVLRGGSWLGDNPATLISSYRRYLPPADRSNDNGFRIILGGAPR